jgi:uncharacterized coiled-coil protein SlyX
MALARIVEHLQQNAEKQASQIESMRQEIAELRQGEVDMSITAMRRRFADISRQLSQHDGQLTASADSLRQIVKTLQMVNAKLVYNTTSETIPPFAAMWLRYSQINDNSLWVGKPYKQGMAVREVVFNGPIPIDAAKYGIGYLPGTAPGINALTTESEPSTHSGEVYGTQANSWAMLRNAGTQFMQIVRQRYEGHFYACIIVNPNVISQLGYVTDASVETLIASYSIGGVSFRGIGPITVNENATDYPQQYVKFPNNPAVGERVYAFELLVMRSQLLVAETETFLWVAFTGSLY